MREQRQWRLRELAITRVLDERGRIDDTLGAADGISVRAVRDTVATARALADLPHVAAAAARGELSDAQLHHVTRLVDPADPSADAHWAQKGPRWCPTALADEVRRRRTPTIAEARARRAARTLRLWWQADTGMLDGRFSLPDVDGALFESVITRLVETMRPAAGEPWEPRDRRAADALVALCRAGDHGGNGRGQPTAGITSHLVVHVPLHGPATVAGIPLPDEMVEALRADARLEPVLVDAGGTPVAVGRVEPALSEKTRRVVRQRDGKCRWPGCERRIGLQIHHLWPRSWGGSDHFANLAAVCAGHHRELVPLGDLLLVGDPNRPDGLTLRHRDDLPGPATHDARAGPPAA